MPDSHSTDVGALGEVDLDVDAAVKAKATRAGLAGLVWAVLGSKREATPELT